MKMKEEKHAVSPSTSLIRKSGGVICKVVEPVRSVHYITVTS